MSKVTRDLRNGFRVLRRNPRFAIMAILILAIGIGSSSAIFTVVNSVLLKPLPFEESDRLVKVWGQFTQQDELRTHMSEPELFDLREESNSLEGPVGYACDAAALTGIEEPEQVTVCGVTADLFSILRVEPVVGRYFLPGEGNPGTSMALILSHSLWQRLFGGDPGIVGQTLKLHGWSATVVGIMPAGFNFPRSQVDLWMPFPLDPASLAPRGTRYNDVIARLKPGVTLEQARAEVGALARRLQEQHPDDYPANSGWNIELVPLLDEEIGEIRPALFTLLGAGVLVLLITSANLANLLLARTQRRKKEFALRTALGAKRWDISRQMLIESLYLSVFSGLIGLWLGHQGLQLLLSLAPTEIPRLNDIRLDGSVLVFTLVISLLAGCLSVLGPTLQASKTSLEQSLRESRDQSLGLSGYRFRGALAVFEITLALLVVIGAGLLMKSFLNLSRTDPGFLPGNLLTMSITLSADYEEKQQKISFFDEVLQRVRALPEVESAAIGSNLPLSGDNFLGGFSIEGQEYGADERTHDAERRQVSPGYFKTMGISLLSGRVFTDQDQTDTQGVVVVDETLAKRYWPGDDAVGKRLRRGRDSDRPWLTVVGVVEHIKSERLDGDSRVQMYFPYQQYPSESAFLVIRNRLEDPTSLVPRVRHEVLEVDPNQPISDVRTMSARLSSSLSRPRFSMVLLSFFAATALILAGVGIYGVFASLTADRSHDIGIHMALGARRIDVFKMVLLQGLMLAAIGLAIGGLAAFLLTRVLGSQLHGLTATDPVTFILAAVVLVAVSLLSVLIPARKATRVNPMIALRAD